jgi:hypothetical protein
LASPKTIIHRTQQHDLRHSNNMQNNIAWVSFKYLLLESPTARTRSNYTTFENSLNDGIDHR